MKITDIATAVTAASLIMFFPPTRYYVIGCLVGKRILSNRLGSYRVIKKGSAIINAS